MTTTYGRSPGGYVWALLQPLILITFLSYVFGLIQRSPSLGTSFMVFYATAILPFRMFAAVSGQIATSIQFSKALLVYPRVTFIDALLARFLLGVLTNTVVSVVILTGIYAFQDTRPMLLDFGPILTAFSLAAFLAVGVGVLNCYLFSLLPLYRIAWGIFTGPLLILSAVLYIYEELPSLAQTVLWWNPLIHLTGMSRSGFFSYYNPEYVSPVYVAIFATIPMFFGLLLLRRYYRYILYI
ncbi:MAG: ABC transporter permease [Rhodobacteraceae bacterium]|nr:ABC transporter permease [Paracoccaceae bacterium]